MSDAPRLDHVAIGMARGADALPWLVGELGGEEYAAGPGIGFRFWQLAFVRGGLIEVLEPDASRFLRLASATATQAKALEVGETAEFV